MKIQSKLFMLLLVMAVVPLVALTWRGQRATESLGLTIISESQLAAVESIETQLGRIVDYSSDVLSGQQRVVELALRVQAAEVERRLAGPVPAAPGPTYSHADFDRSADWPPGTEVSLDRAAVTSDRQLKPLAISTQHQSFFVPSGANPDAAERARLASMDEIYADLSRHAPGLFYWQYTTLESGLHSAYPGHGGYPAGYDPRQRVWYQLATVARDLIWTPPLWDAATRRLLLTAARPIFTASGEIAGVTGIDVEILSVLNAVHAKINLGPNAESFIVRLAEADGNLYVAGESEAQPGLRIVAASSLKAAGADWDAQVEEPPLVSGTPTGVDAMASDLLAMRGGIKRMPHNGNDSIWVYRPLDRLQAGLVYVVPVGDIEAAASAAQESIRAATLEQIRLAGAASIGLIVLVALSAMLAARSITQPLRGLAAAARALANGNLDARAPVTSHDEVGDLAQVFNVMVPELRSHIQNKESLAIAREVQQKLLPASAPSVPGFDVAGASVYSEAVGGDYYDFLCLEDEAGERRLAVVIGDVTGHGVPAALTMMSVRALVRGHAGEGLALLPVMRAVNRHLAADSTRGSFVTLVYMVLESDTRVVKWISAGHGPILFYNADTYGFEELEVTDIPLGVKEDWTYHEFSRDRWPSSGVLVIGTDGVWEMENAEGRVFGKDNLIGVVRAVAHLSAKEICDAIVERLAEFRGTAPQKDDVTLVVVKFLPSSRTA
ncbi:MAG: SpoIIE family protein phosphatase [Rhodospirillaceae bacterium]|nr:SpoIIE family protein phosphatase [Rhodospirillaceae bacterium]